MVTFLDTEKVKSTDLTAQRCIFAEKHNFFSIWGRVILGYFLYIFPA